VPDGTAPFQKNATANPRANVPKIAKACARAFMRSDYTGGLHDGKAEAV